MLGLDRRMLGTMLTVRITQRKLDEMWYFHERNGWTPYMRACSTYSLPSDILGQTCRPEFVLSFLVSPLFGEFRLPVSSGEEERMLINTNFYSQPRANLPSVVLYIDALVG